jgi:uncharacterized protein (UPF0332 family)
MTCNPEALFTAAKTVYQLAADEAMYRAATNRAYYASYHCCRAYNAPLPPAPIQGNGVHEQLINQLTFPSKKLTDNGVKRARTIGKYLRAICTHRGAADYTMDQEFSKDRMDLALGAAEMIFAGTKVTEGVIE